MFLGAPGDHLCAPVFLKPDDAKHERVTVNNTHLSMTKPDYDITNVYSIKQQLVVAYSTAKSNTCDVQPGLFCFDQQLFPLAHYTPDGTISFQHQFS